MISTRISRVGFVRLMGTSSALVLTLASGALAQPVEEVVVTGSHIRGIAPVGSTITSVGQEDMEKAGALNPIDLLRNIPAVYNLGSDDTTGVGGTRIQGQAGNNTANRSINLRGMSTNNTLTLVNGMRFSPGQNGASFDIDAIPSTMVQRIDIVADGGSAVYGTDAVAGTVNIVMRNPLDIIETTARYASAWDGQGASWMGAVTLGSTWDEADTGLGEGGIIIGYKRDKRYPLYAESRANLYPPDTTAYTGAAGAASTAASPGNIVFTTTTAAIAASPAFPVPLGLGPTTPLTLAALGSSATPNRQGVQYMAYPIGYLSRNSVAVNFRQVLTPWLEFAAYGNYQKRLNKQSTTGALTSSSNITVTSAAPYGPCATAAARALVGLTGAAVTTNSQGLTCPAAGVTYLYSWTDVFEAPYRGGFVESHIMGSSFNVKLPWEWQADIKGVQSREYDNATTASGNAPNAGRVSQVVNGTDITGATSVTNGLAKPANVPFFNPFCDPAVSNACIDPVTLAYVFNGFAFSGTNNNNILTQYDLALNGPVFELPGGEIKAAIGVDYIYQSLWVNNDPLAPSLTNYSSRFQRSAYAEIYVPLVGADNAMPFVKSLELTAAARYSHYSDFGSSSNPKVGVNWKPIDDLKIHGTWGTSFRAPTLRDSSDYAAATRFAPSGTAMQTQFIGITGTGPWTAYNLSGGRSDNQPEKSTTYSLGFDWTPTDETLSGLFIGVNYFNINAVGTISTFVRDLGDPGVVNDGTLDDYLFLNPTYFPTRAKVTPNIAALYLPGATIGSTLTQAQYNTVLAAASVDPRWGNAATAPTSPVVYIADGRRANGGGLKTSGFDISTRYDFDTDWGRANVGFTGTYTDAFDVKTSPTGLFIPQINYFGSPLKFRGRVEAGLQTGPWTFNANVAYTNSYSAVAANVGPVLAANPAFLEIGSYTVTGLSVGYDTGEDMTYALRNIRLNLAINNVFDTQPPFFFNNGSPTLYFDPQNASAVGRNFSIQLTKQW